MSQPNTLADTVPKLGRRAANKADKLRRIVDAADALFVENGFDGTTMRDIAARAGVGFGTLFDYATNKRDLLFLIFNPRLETVLDEATLAAEEEAGIVDRLMALFGGYYALWGRERAISRSVLRELTFFSEGAEAQKFLAHRKLFIAAVETHLERAVASGELQPLSVDMVGRTVFALYAWEVRRWLAGSHPSLPRGLADLRALLDIVLGGFRAEGRRHAPPT